jgi:hypothetical protein
LAAGSSNLPPQENKAPGKHVTRANYISFDQGLCHEESESDEEEKTEFSKLFVEDADAEPPDPFLLLERGSVLCCINAALRCFGVDQKHFI